MSDIIKQVTDLMTINKASEYDQERGAEWCISSSSNGFQWWSGTSFDRETAEALRDALTELLETKRPEWTYRVELWDSKIQERITDKIRSHFAPGRYAARDIVSKYGGETVTAIRLDSDGEWIPIGDALKGIGWL